MFEQAFRNIDDVLWKEAGCTTELDYTEQTSWLLFLKYLDGLEEDKADETRLEGTKHTFILDAPYRWGNWAAPKTADGNIDHNKAKTGDDLRDFVNQELFPYLHGFTQKASGPNTIEYKIGQIFGEIKNKISSGYNLREIIDHIDELRFRSQTEKHELSHLYEAKIRNMGNAGRNGGEYYTPRPLIRAIVQVVKPKIGERIYDGAVGSAGFLCESFDYLKAKGNLTTKDLTTLQTRTFYGKEKKSLAYVIAIMNMILHGIDAPNIIRTKLPQFFKDEAELRALWSAPDTRAKLLHGLADKGFGKDQLAEMQKIIDAEKSDLFDVLAHVAYALPTLTREERAQKAKIIISTRFNSKQQVFLDFVLSQYVKVGVDELAQEKLSPLLKLKYHNAIADAVADLGRPEEIGTVFAGFQKYLYQGQLAAA